MSVDRTPRVVVADDDFGDVDIEQRVVTGAGFELVSAANSKSEDEFVAVASDALMSQCAEVGKGAIESFTRCRITARCGIGVHIVDVDEGTRRHITATNVPNDWCRNEIAPHAIAPLMALVRNSRNLTAPLSPGIGSGRLGGQFSVCRRARSACFPAAQSLRRLHAV